MALDISDIPTVLVIAGIFFVFVSLVKIRGKIAIYVRDETAIILGIAGTILIILGLVSASAGMFPSPEITPTPKPTPILTPTSIPTPIPTFTPTPTSDKEIVDNVSECSSGDIYLASVRKLCSGYNMGVDDSQHIRNWLTDMGDYMRMTYPNGLEWGVVFITVGEPSDPPRSSKDFSTFSVLSIDLKAEKSGEMIEIGIKDNTDSDDGSETKSQVDLTTEWQTYEFPIAKFYTAKPTKLYIVAEFVFSGSNAKTIYFRNIKYLP